MSHYDGIELEANRELELVCRPEAKGADGDKSHLNSYDNFGICFASKRMLRW